MANYKIKRRRKLLRGPSILRVFGSSYKYKTEAKTERSKSRKRQGQVKISKLQISTQRSVRAISTPMGNKR
jgi:hypothetical protein